MVFFNRLCCTTFPHLADFLGPSRLGKPAILLLLPPPPSPLERPLLGRLLPARSAAVCILSKAQEEPYRPSSGEGRKEDEGGEKGGETTVERSSTGERGRERETVHFAASEMRLKNANKCSKKRNVEGI